MARPRKIVTPGEQAQEPQEQPKQETKTGVNLPDWELREDGWHYIGGNNADQKND